MLSAMDWSTGIATALLATAVPGALIVGYLNRKGNDGDKTKGIGWQFIRYTVIAMAIPVAGALALNDALTAQAATIIAGALGYAFGQAQKDT